MKSADPALRLLNSFLDYLKVEKGLALLTVSAYQSDLEQYSQSLLKRKRALRELGGRTCATDLRFREVDTLVPPFPNGG